MTWILKNLLIDKLADVDNKCSNTYHSTINMKPVDIKSSNFDKENYEKDPTFNFGNHVRKSKCKNLFCKKLPCKFDWRSFCDQQG